MANFNSGSVVSFKYSGGSTPGAYRVVSIITNTSTGIGGMDLETGEYRNFLYRNMSSAKEVPSVIVDLSLFFGLAKTNLIKTYTQTYSKQGYTVVRHADKLYCYKHIEDKLSVSFGSGGVVFNLGNNRVSISRDFINNDSLTVDNLIKAFQSLKS